MEIKKKNILITGAAKRIGKYLAEYLAKLGGNIVIHYNSSDKEALELEKKLKALGVNTLLVKADLSDSSEVFDLIEKVKKEWGYIDILINNASVYFETPLETVDEEILDLYIGVHLKAPFFLSKEFGSIMFKRKSGRIINIVDYSPLRPYKNFAPYIVTKGALLTMTRVFAKEFAPYVLVNAILPGPIIPPEKVEYKFDPLEKILLDYWAGEEEVAKAVRYLIETNFTTGAFIPVEGGRLIF